MSNKVYDVLKYLVEIVLPALVVLILTLGEIWGLETVKIAGSITAVTVFLGASLMLSRRRYNKDDSNFDGVLHMDGRDPEYDSWTFEMTKDLDAIPDQSQIIMKVKKH